MGAVGFKPKNVTRKIVDGLPERARDILTKRYGLGENGEVMTLESIGAIYGITRERVRQIESHSLGKLRRSGVLTDHTDTFGEIHQKINDMGGVVSESELLSQFSNDAEIQNHIYFLLTVGEPFHSYKPTAHVESHWSTDQKLAREVTGALDKLHKDMSSENLMSEDEVINRFSSYVSHLPEERTKDQNLRRWLGLSKTISKNPLNEWGLTSSPNINIKGIRDYAYLVLRQNGSPMHFSEVTEKIQDVFGKKAHVATTHNELIKDERFVLVGRGLYALKEWGYMQGVVKDVIKNVLEAHGPLHKDEIIDRVLKERYVKANTILVNLQDSGSFQKLDDGRYTIK